MSLVDRWRSWQWQAPILGLVIGLTYGLGSQQLDFETMKNPEAWQLADDIVSVILPTIVGALAGLVYNYVHWQRRINRMLSTQNSRVQRHLLTQTLSSHLLHEIRNPLHNLTAVLEDSRPHLPSAQSEVIERNLGRLRTVTEQLGRWTLLDDDLNLREPVALGPWINDFVNDKVRVSLNRAGVGFEPHVDRVIVEMHPLLLEQCFVALLNNAMEALERGTGTRAITLTANMSATRRGYVEVKLRNTGILYPETALATQGQGFVASPHGPGLGLVLVHRSLELVGGDLALANVAGQACTTLWIPGHQA